MTGPIASALSGLFPRVRLGGKQPGSTNRTGVLRGFPIPAWVKNSLRVVRRLGGHIPLSLPGAILLSTVALGTYYFGSHLNDYVLLVTGGALLLAALVDILVVVFTALFLRYHFRRQTREHLASGYRLNMITGTPVPSGRTLPRVLPPLIEASTHILAPDQFDSEWKRSPDGKRQEWLVSHKRCLLEENFHLRRRVVVKDVLGISALDWEHEELISLTVNPPPLPVQDQNILRARFRGDDLSDPSGEPEGDRVDMRRYAPGDPPRLILWKIYARTGKLMVRVPESSITSVPRTCAYFVSGDGDEALASLARTIVEENFLGQGWLFGADGSATSVDHKEQALRLIARSGNPGVESGPGLPQFLKRAYDEGFGSCILLVPPAEGEWEESVAASISQSPIEITLLTVGSVSQREKQPKWHRWVFYDEVHKTDPSELLARLNSSTVTDWLTFEPGTARLIPLRSKDSAPH